MTNDEKKIIQDGIEEMINSFTRMDAERDLIKEIVHRIKDETTVTPRTFRKMAKVAYKSNFSEEVALHEEFEELYQEVISG